MQRVQRWLGPFCLGAVLALAVFAFAQAYRNETIIWDFSNGIRTSAIGPTSTGGGGLDATMRIGDADTTSVTIATADTGAAVVILPENSVGAGEIGALLLPVIFCGELAENGTTYLGPSTGAFGGNGADLSIGSTACDALDSTTEATADTPLFTNTPLKWMGLLCKTDGTLGASETIVFTARTAAADVVTTDSTATTITCTISVGESECRSLVGSTTNIAAGATVAVKAVETSNNSDDNAHCVALMAVRT